MIDEAKPSVRETRLMRSRFESGNRISGWVYGTIVVMGAVVVGSAGSADPWRVATAVAGTVLVLWIAHVYARAIGESIYAGRRLDRRELTEVAGEELTIPLAAVPPIGALVLGAAGVLRESRAIWAALAIGLLTLAAAGLRYARVEHLNRLATAVSVALNLALGLVIVALEVALSH
jgi:hypothetical protein